ncbi:MAG: 2-C-methyl-D-erythritol 4-phosphate cytidylyltransferase [Ignavibacteriae bacterium]|nr:2-C-methyl-D-erythritol 4-phosphate cytidylyltransferase [Ignavibacteriota bacterium]
MKTFAIIPSGGIGSRILSSIPKQYVKVLGKELIAYTLQVFQNSNLIDEIIIPAQPSYFDLLNSIKEKYNLDKVVRIIEGGKERQDSVYNGLKQLSLIDEDLVVVHDAARPLLSQELLEKSINEAKKYDSIVVAKKASDTLIKGDEIVGEYLDRTNIYYAQTPQIFRYKILLEAFRLANESNFLGTDESMLVKNANFGVRIVEGETTNFKVTTQSDLELLEHILGNSL